MMDAEQSKAITEAVQRRDYLVTQFGAYASSAGAIQELNTGIDRMRSFTKWVHVGDIPGDVIATAIGCYLLYHTPMPVGVQWLWEMNQ